MSKIIVKELATLTLPEELVNQLDLPNLGERLKENFKRLDDLKNIRDEHKNRNWMKKIWGAITRDKTMENAQLDAIEVQAEFSKAIGQLMIISIGQSQYLTEQQVQLSQQQNKLGEQANSIQKHTETLEKQHKDLAENTVKIGKVSDDTKKLVEEYFALKGLTEEGARKLIEIGNDVQNTKDYLLESVEKSLLESEEQVKSELTHTQELVKSTHNETIAQMNERFSTQDERILSVQDKFKFAIADSEKRSKAELTHTQKLIQSTHDKIISQMDVRLATQDERILFAQDKFKSAKVNMVKWLEEVANIFNEIQAQHKLELPKIANQSEHQSSIQRELKFMQIATRISVFLSKSKIELL